MFGCVYVCLCVFVCVYVCVCVCVICTNLLHFNYIVVNIAQTVAIKSNTEQQLMCAGSRKYVANQDNSDAVYEHRSKRLEKEPTLMDSLQMRPTCQVDLQAPETQASSMGRWDWMSTRA